MVSDSDPVVSNGSELGLSVVETEKWGFDAQIDIMLTSKLEPPPKRELNSHFWDSLQHMLQIIVP